MWPGMTDVHTHLLPGVDDGFSSEKDSLAMLAFLEGQGVERIFLTPHIMADLAKNRKDFLRDGQVSVLPVYSAPPLFRH